MEQEMCLVSAIFKITAEKFPVLLPLLDQEGPTHVDLIADVGAHWVDHGCEKMCCREGRREYK